MSELARAGGVEVEEAVAMARVADAPEPAGRAEEAEAPAVAVPGVPLPLIRPGTEDQGVSDFEPDVSMLTLETIRAHRLPLARP